MRLKKRSLIITTTVLCVFLATHAYAALPEDIQNKGSNNIAYDLPSKFYVGTSVGYTSFNDHTIAISGAHTHLDNQSINYGIFGGYKFNDYLSAEVRGQRLGTLTAHQRQAPIPLSYKAWVDNVSLDAILSYPVFTGYHYTTSVYGKAGYGINVANFHYHVNHDVLFQSSSSTDGAYNAGLGLNVDLRNNLSARLGYTYYQALYPLPGNGYEHGAHVFSLGLYYNVV